MNATNEPIISSDDHMDLEVLPPDLWTARLPASLRDRAPRVVDTPRGRYWEADGKRLGPSGHRGARMDRHVLGYRPGDAAARIADLDRDGVKASVIYGPPGGIAFSDRALADACLRAYNDWADEFNAVDRSRLAILAILPSHDPAIAAAELLRCAKLGHRGAVLSLFESKEPVFFDGWEPFWAAANEAGIPLHFHLGGGVHTLTFRARSWRFPAHASVVPMQMDEALCGAVFSGVLERHPRVRIVLGECGLGWIPYLLDRMDYEYRKYYDEIHDYRIRELPSVFWHRQMYATYEDDPFGLAHLDRIGAGNVMWASDFPHGDTTWPESHKAIMESALAGMDAATRRAIVHDNAAKLYGFA